MFVQETEEGEGEAEEQDVWGEGGEGGEGGHQQHLVRKTTAGIRWRRRRRRQKETFCSTCPYILKCFNFPKETTITAARLQRGRKRTGGICQGRRKAIQQFRLNIFTACMVDPNYCSFFIHLFCFLRTTASSPVFRRRAPTLRTP